MSPAAAEALEILALVPFPQPNPRTLMIHLKGGADAVHIKVYSRAFVLVAQLKIGAQAAGWSKIDLQPLLPQIPGGLSFVTVQASRDGARAQTLNTELVRTR